MRVVVAGDFRKPVLLNTTEATAVLIETDDGQPTVIFKLLDDGWVRFCRGEDPNFMEVARQLGLLKK